MDTVNMLQRNWGDMVIRMGENPESASDDLKYIYDFSDKIQIKPSIAYLCPFRNDFEGTLSYYVSGNDKYPEDKGFALKRWKKISFENSSVIKYENIIIAQGNYYFTNDDVTNLKIEYTFVYYLSDGWRIITHHSSLPFN